MSVIETLITDRTQGDYDRWKGFKAKGLAGWTDAERAEWFAGMKGSYNSTDLNRVGEALIYLQDELTGYGYHVATVNPKTNWEKTDIPTPAQMSAYLADVAKIRAVLPVPPDTPEVPPAMGKLTWQRANDIERILADIDRLLNNAAAAFRHCGAAVCGGAGLLVR